MTVTLQPVFEALGYKDSAQQQALVKLLQISGAFGELPGVDGVLDDRQARAIINNVTFDNTQQAAHWLHSVTQENMLRPKDKDRYECVDNERYKNNHDELAKALTQTGMMEQAQPALKHYDHVLLLGTVESGVDTRLDTLKNLWEQGVRFDKIHLLGCDRLLSPEIEPSSNATIRTEMDMMESRYYTKSLSWPKELRDVRVFEVDTFNRPDGRRADTKETIESWAHTSPSAGNVLVISNQPFARYQDAATKAALDKNFNVETVGAASDSKVVISMALDALARQIDVGFTPLLEKLKTAQPEFSTPLIAINPDELKIDAATYQFRSGGDDKGVTAKRYYNTDKWEPVLHGDPILVHERLDGSMYVADGHHRVDLAKRLNESGTGPGKLMAMVLSEKDGYTPQDVKIIAAYKNISRGKTDLIDTAHVFKEANSGDVHKELLPELQMDKGNLQTAYTLSKLSDDSLDKVAKGDVPVDAAAKVAQQIPDKTHQDFAMRIISEQLKIPKPYSYADRIKFNKDNQPKSPAR